MPSAILHTFLSRSYAGFMPIAAREDREDFYVIRVAGEFEDEILYHYKEDGTVLSIQHLGPKRLTYSAVLNEDGTLYFNNNHAIEHYDPIRNEFISTGNYRNINLTNKLGKNINRVCSANPRFFIIIIFIKYKLKNEI